jgi:two-component system, NtrC family, response regulator AtoC
MSQVPIHVLLVDDDEEAGSLVAAFLQAHGHRVDLVISGPGALTRLEETPPPDVCLLDVVMPGMGGIEALRRYREKGGTVPIVMVSAMDEPQLVVQAMRLGANDYVTKPINHEELLETIQRVVELRPMRASTSTSVIASVPSSKKSLGVSAAMRRVEALIDRVADADVPILITGESGVGKDVVSREIHGRSARKDRVFVKINCAALPENLLESELFGYERGAFTGAQRAKPGQFELADGGTLFLDEIGEMPAPLQAKLLQALQDGEFYRVGGQKKVKVDVRIIVATNRDLERAIRDGTFREDLYYRLNVVHIRIPPLRERREDIPALLAAFVDRYGRRYGRSASDVPPDVVSRFLSYDWPGNVRELENLVRRLMVLRDPSYVYAEMKVGSARDESGPHALPMVPLPAVPTVPVTQFAPQAMGAASAMEEPNPGYGVPMRTDYEKTAPIRTITPQHLPIVTAPQPPQPTQPAQAITQVTGVMPYTPPPAMRGGSYPFGGYASTQAARPLGEVVAEEFANAGEHGKVDLKALGRKAAEIAEREAIVAMLARTGGSKREAAERLGISYKAILYKIREFGIGKPRISRKVTDPAVVAAAAAVMDDEEDEVDLEIQEGGLSS